MHLCCYSAAKSCATLCDPMDYSTLGFPVPYHLPEFAQVTSIRASLVAQMVKNLRELQETWI